MSIAIVTTWGVECGIATYSDALAKALLAKGEKVTILAEKDPTNPMDTGSGAYAQGTKTYPPVYRLWDRRSPANAPFGLNALVKAIESSPVPPKVVHFQHEFGLFPDTKGFLDTVSYLAAKGVRVVITLHTVTFPPKFVAFFDRLKELDVVFVVHSRSAFAALKAYWAGNVWLIPHGVRIEEDNDRRGSSCLFLCPGFVGKSKGQLDIVEAAGILRSGVDSAWKLAVVGKCRDQEYEVKLRQAIFAGASDMVEFHEGFQSENAMREWFRKADVVVLGAGDTTPLSASGQLHTALGFGLPVLAKDVPIYREAGSGVLYYSTPEECAFLMKGLLHGETRRVNRAGSLFERTRRSWTDVATMHLTVYAV